MRRVVLLALGLLVFAGPAAHAATGALVNFTTTSWGARDGMPPGTVWSLGQDQAGYLWLGCDGGLLRFDGSMFVPWNAIGTTALPEVPVRTILAHSDGSLWAGFDEPGGIGRIRGREATLYTEAQGLPRGQVRMLVEDPSGVVWAGTSRGLFRFADGRWSMAGAGLRMGSDGVYSGLVTTGGDLLVGTSVGIYRRARGAPAFVPIDEFGPVDNGVRGITETTDGRIVATDVRDGFRRVPGPATARPSFRGRGIQILRDRDGYVWVATGGHGVWRVSFSGTAAATIERAGAAEGPLSEGAFSLLEDRDGNIWAGTSDGLSRLTPHAVRGITELGIASGIAATPGGHVWVSTFDGLHEFARTHGTWQLERQHFPGSRIRALHADRQGHVFAVTNTAIVRFADGEARPTTLVSGSSAWEVASVSTGSDGRLWFADGRLGLMTLAPGDVTARPAPFASRLQGRAILLTYVDRAERLWLAFREGGLGVVEHGSEAVRLLGPEDGVSAGAYRAIHEDDAGTVWLGGRNGLTRFANGTFSTVSGANGFPADHVKAIAQDAAGTLWLGTNIGIVRISPTEYDRALAGHVARWSYQTLDRLDGVAGTPRQLGDRSGTRAADGTIWFVTGSGVTLVDPTRFSQEPSRLLAQTVGLTVDGQPIASSGAVRLPPGVSKIEVSYSALNLTSPHKTRFRYRLEGFDPDWVYANVRRTAFYTNLPPGDYRFHVAASATGFSWNETGDVLSFTIEPHLYETRWFPFAAGGLVLVAILALWRLRTTRMRRQFLLLLDERLRLSREIHDTLLQSMVGVALQCDVLSSEAENPSFRERLTQLRRRVEEYIDECRQSIWDLRSPTLEQRDLLGALRVAGARATAGTTIALSIESNHPQPALPPRVEQQFLRIAQEAITNAVRHAGASSIWLQLHRTAAEVSLRVADNGHGFDVDAVTRDPGGHCGLLSIRERARGVNGQLAIRSAPGQGTEVEVTVPCGFAGAR